MPKATNTPTTSRRSALRCISLASIAAGLAVPALAPSAAAAPPDADAELIALCGQVIALQGKFEALHAIRQSLEAELRTAAELDGLYVELAELMDQISKHPPTTFAGARAMARAAIAIANRDPHGEIRHNVCSGDSEGLAWSVAEWAAAQGGALA
jgi:hypothetical protein